jgi:hypothetical protein
MCHRSDTKRKREREKERERMREKKRENERKREKETYPSFQYKFAQAEINNVRRFPQIAGGTKSRKIPSSLDFSNFGLNSYFCNTFFYTNKHKLQNETFYMPLMPFL